jgi:DNA invertase Pin-like site-specific DNA recombinase
MSKIGYVRVSTVEQNTDRQEIALSKNVKVFKGIVFLAIKSHWYFRTKSLKATAWFGD